MQWEGQKHPKAGGRGEGKVAWGQEGAGIGSQRSDYLGRDHGDVGWGLCVSSVLLQVSPAEEGAGEVVAKEVRARGHRKPAAPETVLLLWRPLGWHWLAQAVGCQGPATWGRC